METIAIIFIVTVVILMPEVVIGLFGLAVHLFMYLLGATALVLAIIWLLAIVEDVPNWGM